MITNKDSTVVKVDEIIRSIRSKLSLEPIIPDNFMFQSVKTKTQLEAAFSIAYEAYAEYGYVPASESKKRFSKYHALPTTITLVILNQGKTIGTASIIQDNDFGLPVDSLTDLSSYRRKGRVAEISNLALDKEYRTYSGDLSVPLCKFIYRYCRDVLKLDYMVIAVNPKHAAFYEAVLVFDRLAQPVVEKYDFANGNPAVIEVMDIENAPNRWAAISRDVPLEKNLFHYFCRINHENFRFPHFSFHQGWDSILDSHLIDQLFRKAPGSFAQLSAKEWAIVFEIYQMRKGSNPSADFATFPLSVRREVRYPVNGKAILSLNVKGVIPSRANARNVSRKGIQFFSRIPLDLGRTFPASILVGPGKQCDLSVKPIWTDGLGIYGAEVRTLNPLWGKFITWLEERAVTKTPQCFD